MDTRKLDKKLLDLMIVTSEECGELTQVCSKIIRKYNQIDKIDKDYSSRLLEEAGDVLCMIRLMVEHGLLKEKDLDARVKVKKEKLKTWSDLV